VNEKLFHSLQNRAGASGTVRDQVGLLETPQRGVYFRGADGQINAHLGHRRAVARVSQQLGEDQDVLWT
jgi:hypothetical protein